MVVWRGAQRGRFAGGVNGCVERCSGRVWGVLPNLQ